MHVTIKDEVFWRTWQPGSIKTIEDKIKSLKGDIERARLHKGSR